MHNFKRSPFFWPSFLLLMVLVSGGTAAIIQAIIPQAVPTPNKTGTNGTIFQLAKSTTPGSAGAAICDDGTGLTTTSGCTANAVTSTTPVTVNTNTTNDQQLMELSLSAGYLNSLGRPFDFFGAGVYTTQAGQTPTLEFKIKLCTVSGCGSGTVVSLVDITTTATTANSPNVSWNLRAVGTNHATGATGNLEIHGNLTADLGNLISTSDTIFTDTNTAVSSNIDLTAALFVDFTIKFSTNAATANTCTQREGVVSPGGSTSGGGGGGGITPSDVNLAGAIASLPAAGTAGRTYAATDGPTGAFTPWDLIRDNGSSWQYWVDGRLMTCPNDGSLSWVNQGTATDTALSCGMSLAIPGAAGFNIHARVKAKLAATFTLTVAFIINQQGVSGITGLGGIIVADGTTAGAGNQAVLSMDQQNSGYIVTNNSKFTNYSTFSANYYATLQYPNIPRVIWLQVQETASNRIWRVSADGTNFLQVNSTGNTDFLTTADYGVFVQDNNVTGNPAFTAHVLSITETNP